MQASGIGDVAKLSTRLTLPCNFPSQIKEHLGWNAAELFTFIATSLNLALRIRRRS